MQLFLSGDSGFLPLVNHLCYNLSITIKNMSIDKNLPLFLHDEKTKEIFKLVIASIPKDSKVYLVGGAIRNAIYYKYFKKELPQRDFDVILIGDKDAFVKNLRAKGFVYGKINRKHQVVLKIKRIPKPKHIFKDYLYLEIHVSEEKSPLKNLKDNSNFTINGSTISLRHIFRADWFDKLISLPGSLLDLRKKRLKLNQLSHPANLFAAMRFMHIGFKQPEQADIDLLLKSLGDLDERRYKKNIRKLFVYVDGEENARNLLKKLKIKQDIFDLNVIKTLK
ncbi:MAG: hypothetical protein ACLFNO_03800 [Parcubacteria group bacterium]